MSKGDRVERQQLQYQNQKGVESLLAGNQKAVDRYRKQQQYQNQKGAEHLFAGNQKAVDRYRKQQQYQNQKGVEHLLAGNQTGVENARRRAGERATRRRNASVSDSLNPGSSDRKASARSIPKSFDFSFGLGGPGDEVQAAAMGLSKAGRDVVESARDLPGEFGGFGGGSVSENQQQFSDMGLGYAAAGAGVTNAVLNNVEGAAALPGAVLSGVNTAAYLAGAKSSSQFNRRLGVVTATGKKTARSLASRPRAVAGTVAVGLAGGVLAGEAASGLAARVGQSEALGGSTAFKNLGETPAGRIAGDVASRLPERDATAFADLGETPAGRIVSDVRSRNPGFDSTAFKNLGETPAGRIASDVRSRNPGFDSTAFKNLGETPAGRVASDVSNRITEFERTHNQKIGKSFVDRAPSREQLRSAPQQAGSRAKRGVQSFLADSRGQQDLAFGRRSAGETKPQFEISTRSPLEPRKDFSQELAREQAAQAQYVQRVANLPSSDLRTIARTGGRSVSGARETGAVAGVTAPVQKERKPKRKRRDKNVPIIGGEGEADLVASAGEVYGARTPGEVMSDILALKKAGIDVYRLRFGAAGAGGEPPNPPNTVSAGGFRPRDTPDETPGQTTGAASAGGTPEPAAPTVAGSGFGGSAGESGSQFQLEKTASAGKPQQAVEAPKPEAPTKPKTAAVPRQKLRQAQRLGQPQVFDLGVGQMSAPMQLPGQQAGQVAGQVSLVGSLSLTDTASAQAQRAETDTYAREEEISTPMLASDSQRPQMPESQNANDSSLPELFGSRKQAYSFDFRNPLTGEFDVPEVPSL